ncbi:hypothetical protein K450DRAFT_284302 [Umbelopsis ramanniana AG]|uniref:Uncharacterized protein n=1 Tax=Umbelopsis ramanniana AG TaxID=1314678 RepID=A0AAD5H807_UMBRA|nr:uncharacterized protein K450DRAFT_284302 [Umbelopsis ramanniana AG]KAI8575505.1 hypothetical protein K450DRAFT_284302 [Umbelopsis ramanniana AG]
MVQLQLPNASSESLPQDTNLRQFLQRQANVELDEVQTKSISEWIKLGHEYLRDFDEAILRDDSDAAYIKFLIASRISYNIIPVHPNHPHMAVSEQSADDLLRKKILDNFAGFMRSTVPVVIARETAILQGGSPTLKSTDRITPPASPVLSTVIGLDNDHRSFLSTDSISHFHNTNQDNMSVHSESTTGHVSTSSAMTYDTASMGGQEQMLHPINSSLSLSEPLMSNDDIILTDAYNMLGSSVAREHTQQTNTYDGPSRASTITGRAHNGSIRSSYAASKTMTEMVDEINNQLEQQNLKKFNRMTSRRRYARDSDISSDEDEDDIPQPSNYSNSQPSPLPSPHVTSYPTVGFHNGYAPPDEPTPSRSAHNSISRSSQYNGIHHEQSPEGSPMSPSSDIFPLDIPPQMLLQRTNDETHAPEMREIQGSQTDVNRPYVARSDSVVTHVLEPVESITLSLQDASNVFYKPDELDSPVNDMREQTTMQKPEVPDTRVSDTQVPTSPSIASSTSSKGTIISSVSHASTSAGTLAKASKSFFGGFKGGKKTIKVDGSTNKVVTSTVPQPPRRKESKTQQSYTSHTSHYTPFGSLVGKKGDVSRSANHGSRTHLPTEPPPPPKPVVVETRNSISDDDNISDSEVPPNLMGASVPDHLDSFGDHRSSVASGSLHDHRSSIASNSSQEHRYSMASSNNTQDHRPSIVSNNSQEHRTSVASNNNFLDHRTSIASKPLPIPHPDHTFRNTNSVRSPSNTGGEGIYSTSPASILNSSKAAPSPRQPPVSHEPDRSAQMPKVGPTIERLRRYAQSNMDFVKYMSFQDLISFATDLFVNMRKLQLEGEYEDAYIHGMQAMIVATYVLPRHVECHSGSGMAYYRYIELAEMIKFRYKDMLANIQNIIENNELLR